MGRGGVRLVYGAKIEQDAANPAVWREETETRYFLDFSVGLPDELFKPE